MENAENQSMPRTNIDESVVRHFGKEWKTFTNDERPQYCLESEFNAFFEIFPWESLPEHAEGFDAGCGTGRWAAFIAPRVGILNCIDPSEAIDVARKKLEKFSNVRFYHTTINDMPLADHSQDFGCSLGVLHHIPDTKSAMQACVRKLKPGAPFLVFMYQNYEGRPKWYKMIWRFTDTWRKFICKLPHSQQLFFTNLIATFIYYPLSRTAWLCEKCHLPYENIPLASHRKESFYQMRNMALDRFGTALEKRYSRAELKALMESCDLERVQFGTHPFYRWVALGYKKA